MACADQRTGSGLNSFTVFVSVYRIVDLSFFVVPAIGVVWFIGLSGYRCIYGVSFP